MRKLGFYGIMLCVLMSFCVAGPALAAKTVVVMAGVTEAASVSTRTNMVYDGIKETLKPAGIVPAVIWTELDALATPELKVAAVDAALAKARAMKPDLIIATNDNLVGILTQKVTDIPVVFCWIFAPPQYLGLPKDNFTGITRMSYAVDNWIMAKQLFGAKIVGLLSRDNPSMQGVKGYLTAGADKLEAASGVRYKDMFLVKTMDEWKKAVESFPYDFIYLADTSEIQDGDKVLSRDEVTTWTVAHSKVPVIAATESDVAAGALFSVVTSERTIGIKAGESALKVLSGTAPSQVPYVTSSKGRLLINMKTAQQYKIDIPYDLLASADKVYE